jgi:pumilio RNA-binding family
MIVTILGGSINPDAKSLVSIKGLVVKIAKEQEGSRFIQQRLAVAVSDEVQIVFDEVMPVIEELWNDVYGNFIIQKLFEFGTPDMKDSLAKRLLSETISLSTKVYGCRVIQKAFDELNPRDVTKFMSTLKDNVLLCLNDHNGNHVIQKAISIMFSLANDARENGNEDLCQLYLHSINPIIDEIINLIEVLGQHTYGCRAVQRMVEYCIEPQKSKILDSIIICQETLLCHAYGNYVIQKVLEHGRPSDRDSVFHMITKSVNLYSKQKQASNVVEALLRYGNSHHRHEIVEAMLIVSSCTYFCDCICFQSLFLSPGDTFKLTIIFCCFISFCFCPRTIVSSMVVTKQKVSWSPWPKTHSLIM